MEVAAVREDGEGRVQPGIADLIGRARAGDGERLFGETSGSKPMRLIHARTVGDSLAFLTYQPAVR